MYLWTVIHLHFKYHKTWICCRIQLLVNKFPLILIKSDTAWALAFCCKMYVNWDWKYLIILCLCVYKFPFPFMLLMSLCQPYTVSPHNHKSICYYHYDNYFNIQHSTGHLKHCHAPCCLFWCMNVLLRLL